MLGKKKKEEIDEFKEAIKETYKDDFNKVKHISQKLDELWTTVDNIGAYLQSLDLANRIDRLELKNEDLSAKLNSALGEEPPKEEKAKPSFNLRPQGKIEPEDFSI